MLKGKELAWADSTMDGSLWVRTKEGPLYKIKDHRDVCCEIRGMELIKGFSVSLHTGNFIRDVKVIELGGTLSSSNWQWQVALLVIETDATDIVCMFTNAFTHESTKGFDIRCTQE